MLDDIESGKLPVARETINVKEWLSPHCDSLINEDYMSKVMLSGPVIQAEIRYGRFEIINGNHRMAKALREGIPFIDSYKLTGPMLLGYLIDEREYKAYIEYWNDKLHD